MAKSTTKKAIRALGGSTRHEGQLATAAKGRVAREAVVSLSAALDAVPTNWVDSLLTGPDGIGRPPYNCRTIEKLLNGVRARIQARAA